MAMASMKKQSLRKSEALPIARSRGKKEGALPAETDEWGDGVPNAETLAAIEEVRAQIASGARGGADFAEFFSVEDLMADLNADD